MLAAVMSPEVILLHGRGICVPFFVSSPYKVVGSAQMDLQVELIHRRV
jgi:hypothetical protein